MRPMLAVPAPDGLPGDGQEWAYEVKWDGMRVLADIHEGTVALTSRTGRDVTVTFPELQGLAKAHSDVLLDGEVVVLDRGIPSFAALADRIHVTDPRKAAAGSKRAPATLIVFDAMRLYGVDLTRRTWTERREALLRLGPSGMAWQLSPAYDDRDSLMAATLEQGLEGVVAKRRASTYKPGVRSPEWLKHAHKHHQVAVIGGWRRESDSPGRIGALLLGIWTDGGTEAGGTVGMRGAGGGSPCLRFAGRVGSGLAAGGVQADLARQLTPLRRDDPPFDDDVPRADAKGTVWVEPRVVVEVRHLGHTDGGRLRQPVFRGVRTDVDPASVRDE